jgi:leucyl/phenylalanyl-tRNA--protein transferase
MPVFRLGPGLGFPDPRLAEPGGLLAVGGDLAPERLVLAYGSGIFPWPGEGERLLWWSPDPRFVLLPGELRVARSLEKLMRRAPFRLTMDRSFAAVIDGCAAVPRRAQDGTWITGEMKLAYGRLHELGLAHSVEAWQGEELVGGLYGVSLGSAFFGESMFTRRSSASKVAFASAVRQLALWGFDLVDCQIATPHLAAFGAREIAIGEFLDRLHRALARPTRVGRWAFD